MSLTASETEQWTTDAVQAVEAWTAADPADAIAAEARARREVTLAVRAGITAAVIAARVGVRQLLVARLVDDADARRQALIAARHDAERYAEQVREAIRTDVLAELAGGAGEQPTAARWGLSRTTVRHWSGKPVEGWN